MASYLRRIAYGCILVLALLSFSSCGKRFSILEYQMKVVSVKPGTWENGTITRYPSVDIRIEGPDTQDWEIIVSPDNGAMPYTESTVTGKLRTITLEGIDLSKDRREMGITIQAIHVNSGETLAVNRQYKATIEGEFDPPAPQETISISSVSLAAGGETSPITVTGGNKATFDILENGTGFLVISYSKNETETGPVSCTLSQTDGKNYITLPKNEDIISGESSFTIPFTSGEPGTGSFTVTLKGKGPETVLVISYIVKDRPHEATFTPNHFTFAGLEAHGTVSVFGFAEGEKCKVILYWKETTSGDEGSTVYEDVDTQTPLEVTLWQAGEATRESSYLFWAEVYEDGETAPAAVTAKQTVTPFALSFFWTDAHGDAVSASERVRSWSSSSIAKLAVGTASWAPEYISMVTVKDVTAGRSYSSQEAVPESEGAYSFEIKHPKRGVHQFTVTLETQEGVFAFDTEMTFVDVWKVNPYAKGSSLFIKFVGPVSSLKTDCNMSITLHGYALWDYTVAETNESGQRVNTPLQEKIFIGSRTEPFTIEKGTSSGADIKVKPIAGLFNIAMHMLKDKCSGKPFSMTGLTASRWNGENVETYTPAASNTFVRFEIKADDPFYEDYNELETDISQLKSTLSENGIFY